MKRYGNIELEGNVLEDVRLENLASSPTTRTGRVYFNTTDAVAQVHDGSGWVNLWAPDDDFYNNLANEGTPDGNDSIVIYDNSAAGYKRQTRDNFFSNITGYLPAPVSPAGSNRYIQFNDNGNFGASEYFQWTSTDYLWLVKSHTSAFSETVLSGDVGLVVQNPNSTTGIKYTGIGFQARYSVSYQSFGTIVFSTSNPSSDRGSLNFSVTDDDGDVITPLIVDGSLGAVLKDINGVFRIYTTPVGATVSGDLIVNDSGTNTVRCESSTASDVYYELKDNTATRGIFGWDASDSLVKLNYGALSSKHIVINSTGNVAMGTDPETGYVLKTDGGQVEFKYVTSGIVLLVVNESTVGAHSATFINKDTSDGARGVLLVTGPTDQSSGTYDYVICLPNGTPTPVGYLRNTNGSFAAVDPSDERIKANIVNTNIDAVEVLQSLPIRDFNFRTPQGGISKILTTGYIAQEAAKAYPLMASYSRKDDLWGVSKEMLVPVLHRGWQVHENRIMELEREVAELKKKLDEKVR